MLRVLGQLLHPIAQLRRVNVQVLRRLHIGHASIFDQAHGLKLELSRKLPSLHDPPPAPSKHLTRCLRNRVQATEIIRRIAIHTTTENFGLLRNPFEPLIVPTLFSSGHRHELYRLLQERFASLSAHGKEAVISALRALNKPTTGEDPERRLKYTQREWLTAIKDQPEASGWYAELST